MQFYNVFLAAAAFTLASAQAGGVEFTMPTSFFTQTYSAGTSKMNLTWDKNSGTVNLKLKNGPAASLLTVATIASK
jgi:hypothetical protein